MGGSGVRRIEAWESEKHHWSEITRHNSDLYEVKRTLEVNSAKCAAWSQAGLPTPCDSVSLSVQWGGRPWWHPKQPWVGISDALPFLLSCWSETCRPYSSQSIWDKHGCLHLSCLVAFPNCAFEKKKKKKKKAQKPKGGGDTGWWPGLTETTVLNPSYTGTNWLLTQLTWADPCGISGALKGHQPGHARTPPARS